MKTPLVRSGPILLMVLRWVALAAPVAAGLTGFAARWAHMRAFNAMNKSMGLPPGETSSEIAWGTLYCVGPWLIVAILLAITLRKPWVLMDCCRVVVVMVAWFLIFVLYLPDIEMWWPAADGPFGDGLPSGDFDSWLDIYLSYPLCVLTVVCFVAAYAWAKMRTGHVRNRN